MRLPPALLLAALALPVPALAAPPAEPSAAETTAIFKAAGFIRQRTAWKSACGRDDPSAAYMPGELRDYRDFNGDGRPDAILAEGSSFCYGMTGEGFWLLSKQPTGAWKLMAQGTGIPEILATKGVGNWPDISIGGPGFCFPVWRWNGKAYTLHRKEYEGKRCR